MEKTKLYILTGFLGSGKTTLLLKLLEHLKGHKAGVLQNEFGKVNVDGLILKNGDIRMVEISRGSIFCSCMKLNFVAALKEMASMGLEYLFVESSGLGDPSNVQEILDAAGAVSENGYDFRGVLCTVDALNFKDQIGDLETVNRQLKHCHLALVTKSDLVPADQIGPLKEQIREINPVCRIAMCDHGTTGFSFLEEDLRKLDWAENEETTNSPDAKPKTLFMNLPSAVDEDELCAFLEFIAPECYRIKGFCDIASRGKCRVDVVGQRIDIRETEEDNPSQLVLISRTGPAFIKPIFTGWKRLVHTEMELKN